MKKFGTLFFVFRKKICGSEKNRLLCYVDKIKRNIDRSSEAVNLGTFSTDTSRQLDVLGHDRYTLGMDGTQVGILEETDQICLAGFLKSHHGGALETQVGLEILSDLTDETLEGQFPDQQFGTLLVTTDLTESDRSGPVTMGFFHTSGGGRTLTCGLRGQLFTRGLSSGGFTSGLLGTSHRGSWLIDGNE